jgi:hypothetical protein
VQTRWIVVYPFLLLLEDIAEVFLVPPFEAAPSFQTEDKQTQALRLFRREKKTREGPSKGKKV